MKILDPETLQKVREQFDSLPYPQVPIDKSPKNTSTLDELFVHNLVTPHYLHFHKIVDTADKVILDAGCGSGYKSLILAEANPGARVVGVDLSPASIDFARQRLQYHGFDNVEFHTMPLEDVANLGMKFDYINCDEVLYLVPNPSLCLRSLQSVLNQDGIIRGNFHSQYQRQAYYRAQLLFKQMGLLENNPEDMEVELVVEIMKALKPQVNLKQTAWKARLENGDQDILKTEVLANHLLQGDRGFTIPEIFSLLEEANLEFISMVNWHRWSLEALFNEPDNLHPFLAMSLPEISQQERLHLFELLHPAWRLLDFWCSHPSSTDSPLSPQDWTEPQWHQAQIHIHPQLQHPTVRQALESAIQECRPFNFQQLLPLPATTALTIDHVAIDYIEAACLLPLWTQSQSFSELVTRLKTLCPVDPLTLNPISETVAMNHIQQLLLNLTEYLYVLLELA